MENHRIFGASVIAAAAGTVSQVVDGNKDEFEVLSEVDTTDDHDFAVKSLQQRNQGLNLQGLHDIEQSSNTVVIEYDNGESTLYTHLKMGTIVIKIGDQVNQGQAIGQVGNSGNSLSPHLHFGLHSTEGGFLSRSLLVKFINLFNRYHKKIASAPLSGDILFAK